MAMRIKRVSALPAVGENFAYQQTDVIKNMVLVSQVAPNPDKLYCLLMTDGVPTWEEISSVDYVNALFGALETSLIADIAEVEDNLAAGEYSIINALGINVTATPRTATADGLTTGVIGTGTSFVATTSANAAHILTLPATVVGTVVRGYVGANGFELKPPASTGINGGVGSNFSSAIGANLFWEVIAVSTTQLLGSTMTVSGVKAAMAVAD